MRRITERAGHFLLRPTLPRKSMATKCALISSPCWPWLTLYRSLRIKALDLRPAGEPGRRPPLFGRKRAKQSRRVLYCTLVGGIDQSADASQVLLVIARGVKQALLIKVQSLGVFVLACALDDCVRVALEAHRKLVELLILHVLILRTAQWAIL
jgi:hypothetical protein